MKQTLLPQDFAGITPAQKTFIELWAAQKGYPPLLTLGQVIELLITISHNLHAEESDGRFFNNILINNESVIGWDGEHLLDILWYETIQEIRQLLINSA